MGRALLFSMDLSAPLQGVVCKFQKECKVNMASRVHGMSLALITTVLAATIGVQP
jgi:hypothetical protein